MKSNNLKRGFTLIELLVVIAIIGVLAAVVLTSVSNARAKGRDARRMSDIKAIQNAIELYIAANGVPPAVPNNAAYDRDLAGGWNQLATALQPYIKTLPRDPCSGSGANCIDSNPSNIFGTGTGAFYTYGYYSPAGLIWAQGAGMTFNPNIVTTTSYIIAAEQLETKNTSFILGSIPITGIDY